ncbi:MAG: phosphoglycerate dehydrogenase, partial [Planctomycetaceae bacterium]
QELVAIEAAEILSGFLLRGEVRHAVNMMPLTAAEMADVRVYLDLARRLGLLLAQSCRSNRVTAAQLVYRGAAASKNTKLLTSAFAAGLLEQALDDYVNIVNAELLAKERGIRLTESTSTEQGDFATLIRATVET